MFCEEKHVSDEIIWACLHYCLAQVFSHRSEMFGSRLLARHLEAPSAKLRKHDAVGNLRELADELGVQRTAKLQDPVCAHVVITMLSLVTCRGHAPHHGLHPHPSSFYIFETPNGVR